MKPSVDGMEAAVERALAAAPQVAPQRDRLVQVRAALTDLRVSSRTRGVTQMFDMGENNPLGLYIAAGTGRRDGGRVERRC